MATGFTYGVAKGEVTDFADFAMDCAQAFIADMRDAEPGTPIPREFKPDSYHSEALAQCYMDLAAAKAMTRKEARAAAAKEHRERLAKAKEFVDKEEEVAKRCETMLAKVVAWEAPEPLVPLREFMISQLNDTIEHDGPSDFAREQLAMVENRGPLDPESYKAQKIAQAEESIAYHADNMEKERKLYDAKNARVQALYAEFRPRG